LPHGDQLELMKHFELTAPSELEARVERLERQLNRERKARLEAEAIAEKGLRDLYESQQWLLLLQRITEGANESDDVRASVRLALREVCRQMGWDFGNAFLVDPATGDAVPCDAWFAEQPDKLFAFLEASRQMRFPVGIGLPGRVLRDGVPHWIPDVRTDEGFLRRNIARDCGIISGCAFPILIKDEVVALLEFFSARTVVATDTLVGTMTQVGTQLGRVIERERSRQALLHDALHDSLTGLPNRVLLAERCDLATARLPQDKRGVAILVIDLDGFKTINDRYGHHTGDALIKEVAARLLSVVQTFQSECEAARSVWYGTVSRTGGDEFVVLLDGLADEDQISELSHRVHRTLEKPFFHEGQAILVAASIGVAQSSVDHDDINQLLRDADLAMYEAKSEGKGRTVEFSKGLGDAIRSRRQLELELREAIRDCQFELNYQPILDMQSELEVKGYEALVRWNHPARGLLGPSEFIEVAEETGLIAFLGNWVLHEACDAIARLHAMGDAQARRFVSINVAPMQFLQRNFAAQVRRTLMSSGVDPRSLRLEVTEGVAIIDPVRTAEILAEVREWGVQTSLDDFGTGYSSLSYLQKLPFDSIKIDKSFVSALSEKRSQDIIKAILDLARSMNLSVVAEGIENDEQGQLLAGMGCQFAQGYLYGRPMPEAEAFVL